MATQSRSGTKGSKSLRGKSSKSSPNKKRKVSKESTAAGALSAPEQAKALRLVAEQDLLFLFNSILLPIHPPDHRKFDSVYHYDFADFLSRPEPKKVVMVARDFVKSTMLSAYVIQRILRNPDIAISWGHAVKASAIVKSVNIRSYFEICQALKDIAPDVCYDHPDREADKWTEQSWTIRRKHFRADAPTLYAFGLDSLPTSLHSELAILDDLVVKENSTTPELIEKTCDQYKSFLPVLSSQAEVIISGTPWAYKDLLTRLEKDGTYIVFKRPAIYQSGPLKGESIWPETWPLDKLLQRIKDVGVAMAAANYHLKPLPAETLIFREEYFNNRLALPDKMRANRFLYVDPQAIDNAKGLNAQTGFVTVLFAEDHKRYVEDAFGEFCGQMDIIDRIWLENERDFNFKGAVPGTEGFRQALRAPDNHRRKRLNGLCVEVNVPMVTQAIMLKEQIQRYGRVLFPIHELRHSGDENKSGPYGRISGLQRHYAAGKIVHYPGLAGGELEAQLLQHPKSPRKDIADALSFSDEYGYYPSEKEAPPQPERVAGQGTMEHSNQKEYDISHEL